MKFHDIAILKKQIWFSLVLLSLSLSLTSCMFGKPEELKMISPQELYDAMKGKDVFLMDVHIPEQRHIKGTDLFAPFNNVEEFADKLPKDKETPVYIYCKGGPMGNAAAKSLFKLGYKHLYNLEGGADNWKKSGYPVE